MSAAESACERLNVFFSRLVRKVMYYHMSFFSVVVCVCECVCVFFSSLERVSGTLGLKKHQ